MSNIKRVYGFVVETRNPSDSATFSILSQAPGKASQWRYIFGQSMLQSLQTGWRDQLKYPVLLLQLVDDIVYGNLPTLPGVVVGVLRDQRGLVEAVEDELEFARIILVVEDCWHVGSAVRSLLKACGADVAGPIATTAAAEHLICKQIPDVALVDFCLRGGERADALINQLHDRGVRVIVITGYGALAPGKADAFLQKPTEEMQLLACLRSVTAQKSRR